MLRKRARQWLAYALYWSGLLWVLARVRLRNKTVVLMYHRVLPDNADSFSAEQIIVSPETFARQMGFLKRHFQMISADSLCEALERRKPLPSMSCVVTFDDGWRDNVQHALPILRSTNVPATIFLATDYIDSKRTFWQERLTRLMFAAAQAGGEARQLVMPQLQGNCDTLPPAKLKSEIRRAVTRMKAWSLDEVRDYDAKLMAALGASSSAGGALGEDVFLSWSEVDELLRDSAVRVGSHCCSHTPLTALPESEVLRELRDAREKISTAVNSPIGTLAYPNGDHDDTVVAMAEKAGYRIAFTTRKGVVGSDDHPLRVPRVNIYEASSATIPEFLCTVLLVFHRLR